MIAIKTERTQISFLSDVLVAVGSLDYNPKTAIMYIALVKSVGCTYQSIVFFLS